MKVSMIMIILTGLLTGTIAAPRRLLAREFDDDLEVREDQYGSYRPRDMHEYTKREVWNGYGAQHAAYYHAPVAAPPHAYAPYHASPASYHASSASYHASSASYHALSEAYHASSAAYHAAAAARYSHTPLGAHYASLASAHASLAATHASLASAHASLASAHESLAAHHASLAAPSPYAARPARRAPFAAPPPRASRPAWPGAHRAEPLAKPPSSAPPKAPHEPPAEHPPPYHEQPHAPPATDTESGKSEHGAHEEPEPQHTVHSSHPESPPAASKSETSSRYDMALKAARDGDFQYASTHARLAMHDHLKKSLDALAKSDLKTASIHAHSAKVAQNMSRYYEAAHNKDPAKMASEETEMEEYRPNSHYADQAGL